MMDIAKDPILNSRDTKAKSDEPIRNILVLSVSFSLLFMVYFGLGALQSSLHLDQGLGVITQAVLYAVMFFSNLLLPKLMISCLGHKWTMIVSAAGFLLWVAANGYGTWATLMPASMLVGMVASPLWVAQSSYVALTADQSAKVLQEDKGSVIARYSGIFSFFLRIGGSWFTQ